MNDSLLLGLVQNTAILLSLSMLYEYIWLNKVEIKPHIKKGIIGVIIGVIGIILMLTSWKASSGVVFDTRSILLSISGLFFGAIPTIIAMLITGIYRFMMGGDGVLMGIAVIVSSGTIGIVWNQLMPRFGNQLKWVELLLMGYVVHVVMLFSTFLLPPDKIYSTISYLILPLITIYPLGNMMLGLFMNRQLQNLINRQSLSNTEKKYSSLYESMSDAYIVMDADLKILECNNAMQELVGYNENELLKLNSRDITLQKWNELDQKIIRDEVHIKGNSQVYEKECIKKDGTIVPVELRVHLLKNEYDEPKGYWAIIRDISLRKNAISEINNEKKRLRTILETVPEMIWLKDTEGKYLNCNINFSEFIGYKEQELVGKSDHFIFEDKSIADFYFAKDQEVINTKKTIRFVNWAKSATSSKEILTETIKTPMYDANGNVTGVLGVSRDISEIKKAEEELLIAKEQAEASDKLKSIFLANMSHEIRTPMNAIMGFSELLIDAEIDAVDRIQYVNIIQQSGNRLLQIIDDIVDLSKLEMNQLVVKKAKFNLADTINESIDICKRGELIKSKTNLELIAKHNPDIQRINLNSDITRVQQILDNLINNAIKFSESGRVEVGYNLVEEEHRNFVEVYVKDDGIGIPKDRQNVIFERFRQGDEEHFIDGAGLGLSICKGLVELLGGNIRFESQLGEGSTFYFSLPVDDVKINNKRIEIETCCNNSNTKKILVAENDYNSFLYVKKLFDNQNVEIIYAENSNEMLQKIKISSPDLLIMDLNISGKNSLTCLDEIKNSSIKTKIIAQTAYVVNGEKERCMNAGCDGFITKPFSREELFTQVRKVLV